MQTPPPSDSSLIELLKQWNDLIAVMVGSLITIATTWAFETWKARREERAARVARTRSNIEAASVLWHELQRIRYLLGPEGQGEFTSGELEAGMNIPTIHAIVHDTLSRAAGWDASIIGDFLFLEAQLERMAALVRGSDEAGKRYDAKMQEVLPLMTTLAEADEQPETWRPALLRDLRHRVEGLKHDVDAAAHMRAFYVAQFMTTRDLVFQRIRDTAEKVKQAGEDPDRPATPPLPSGAAVKHVKP